MWRFLRVAIPRTLLRLCIAFSLYGLVGAIPWPAESAQWVAVISFAALAASVIAISGKLLYDTLFYERYWRQMDSR